LKASYNFINQYIDTKYMQKSNILANAFLQIRMFWNLSVESTSERNLRNFLGFLMFP